MIKLTTAFFIGFLLVTSLFAQSKTVEDLKEADQVMTGYYFIPSTLRMINIERNPEFDKLVKPIRRLNFLNLRDSFTSEEMKDAVDRLITEEEYETYAEMSGPEQNLHVLGLPEKEYTCVLAELDGQFYISEIQGKVNVLQLAELYQEFEQRDSTSQEGLIDVFSMFKKDSEDKIKREERERKREARRKKEEEEKHSETQDSIKTEKPVESEE
ncbi:MAG: DUF4252 domain-containing protein [Saprospiraceae bacterium]|nr:DUF4252 domain-containing protein [Saprospiraceae bacterium]